MAFRGYLQQVGSSFIRRLKISFLAAPLPQSKPPLISPSRTPAPHPPTSGSRATIVALRGYLWDLRFPHCFCGLSHFWFLLQDSTAWPASNGAHAGQVRKETTIACISHPTSVAALILEAGRRRKSSKDDEDVPRRLLPNFFRHRSQSAHSCATRQRAC